MKLISEDYLMHYGVKGMKWGVRHDPERSMRGNIHRGLSKVYSLNEKTYRKLGNNTLASMNAAAKNEQLKKAKSADKQKTEQRRYGQKEDSVAYKYNKPGESGLKGARRAIKSNFAKGVGQTYRVNEFVEKKKEKAWSKASDKPVIGKYASKKQNTAKENARFYEKTRTDLTSGKVAPARNAYAKVLRAAFFKNPAGKAWTINSIKDSKYLKTGQQKATALAEVGLMDNFYAEQKKLKKEGKPHHKY